VRSPSGPLDLAGRRTQSRGGDATAIPPPPGAADGDSTARTFLPALNRMTTESI